MYSISQMPGTMVLCTVHVCNGKEILAKEIESKILDSKKKKKKA